MVCTTLNMDHRKLRTELSQEIRKKIIDKHVKGKGYKTISKQFDIPVTTVAHIIQKFKVQGTVANLPGRGRKRKIDDKLKRRIIRMVTKEPEQLPKRLEVNSKVKVHQCQIAPSVAVCAKGVRGGHHCWLKANHIEA